MEESAAKCFTRQCPQCEVTLVYRDYAAFMRANRRQSVCKPCGGKILPTKIKNPEEKPLTAEHVLPNFWKLIEEQLSGSQCR